MGAALARAPGAQLGQQVVAWQAQQTRDLGLHAHQRSAVAGLASGQPALCVALLCQVASACQYAGVGRVFGAGCEGGRDRWRIRQILRCKVGCDVRYVVVRQVPHHVCHQGVRAPPVTKVLQLRGEITRRLARDAWKVALGCGAAFFAVARRAGLHALLHAWLHVVLQGLPQGLSHAKH